MITEYAELRLLAAAGVAAAQARKKARTSGVQRDTENLLVIEPLIVSHGGWVV
jgi:hypothetical protein